MKKIKNRKMKPLDFYMPYFQVFTIFYQIDVFVAFLIF